MSILHIHVYYAYAHISIFIISASIECINMYALDRYHWKWLPWKNWFQNSKRASRVNYNSPNKECIIHRIDVYAVIEKCEIRQNIFYKIFVINIYLVIFLIFYQFH